MSTVRQFLDLSTSHLPFRVLIGDEYGPSPLKSLDGVVAYSHDEFGWLVWVPDDPDEVNEDHDIPAELLAVQKHARSLNCDYVLFDRDGPVDQELPTWNW